MDKANYEDFGTRGSSVNIANASEDDRRALLRHVHERAEGQIFGQFFKGHSGMSPPRPLKRGEGSMAASRTDDGGPETTIVVDGCRFRG